VKGDMILVPEKTAHSGYPGRWQVGADVDASAASGARTGDSYGTLVWCYEIVDRGQAFSPDGSLIDN
jgi:hypothetical protein